MFVCYYRYVCISQASVEMHLRCGGIYRKHMTANCPLSVPVKNFENRSIIGKDINKNKVACFYWATM